MTIVASGNTGDALANLAASTVVTPNLISQIHAGERAIVFTSRHAEAAGFADCGYANPTGCILSAVTLLDHLGNRAAAATILHALLATLEEGSELTPDIACRYPGVSTRQFTNAVIANLGNRSTAHSAAHWPYVQLPRTVPPALEHVVNQ
jgi:isocitrate/isopropylmalate dehydrogenase